MLSSHHFVGFRRLLAGSISFLPYGTTGQIDFSSRKFVTKSFHSDPIPVRDLTTVERMLLLPTRDH